MKLRMLVVGLLAFGEATFANCFGEAQLTGTIERVEKVDDDCIAFPKRGQVLYFSSNPYCPMDFEEIVNAGLVFPMNSKGQCPMSNSPFSGVVVRGQDGRLRVE